MTLLTKIEPNKITFKLLKNRRVTDIEEMKYYNDISEVLISALDKLLKRNRLDVRAIKSYKVLDNLHKNSTSYKIVAAFIEGLKAKG